MVESRIIKGNVCQLLCLQQAVSKYDGLLEKPDPENESGLVIEISSKGDYLRHKKLALRNPAITMDANDDEPHSRCSKDMRFLLNQEGKLLQLFILLASDKTLKEPEILPAQNIVDELSPTQVVLPHPGWTN